MQTAKIKERLKQAAEVKTTATQAEAKGVIAEWNEIASSPESTLDLRAAATQLVRELELHSSESAPREAALRALGALAQPNH